jgi:hypothetical protein
MFFMLLLQNDTDVAIVNQDACMNCTREKLGTEILRAFRIDKTEFKELKANGAKGYNVKCSDDCNNYKLIDEF